MVKISSRAGTGLTGAIRTVANWCDRNFLLIVCLLATVLCTYTLGDKPLWNDEAGTQHITKDWEVMRQAIRYYESNMWLYYFLMHYWQMAGTGEAWLRLFSVIASVLAVLAIYWLGRILYSEPSAKIAALLLTVNGFFVYYAQEARSYSLHLMLAAVAACFLALAVREDRWKWWIGYCLLTAAGAYAHLFALLIFSAQIASLVCLRRPLRFWLKPALCAVGIGLLILPILMGGSFRNQGIGWIPPLTWDVFRAWLTRLSGGSDAQFWLMVALLATGILVAGWYAGTWRRSFDFWASIFPAIWIIGVLFQTLAYSAIKRPLFVDRYLIAELIPLCLLCARILSLPALRAPAVAWLALYLIMSICTLFDYYETPGKNSSDWRSISAYIQSRGTPKDAVLVYPYWSKAPADYYLNRWRELLDVPGAQIVDYHPPGSKGRDVSPDPDVMDSLKRRFFRIWHVTVWADKHATDIACRETRRFLDQNFTLSEEKMFPCRTAVCLYERSQ